VLEERTRIGEEADHALPVRHFPQQDLEDRGLDLLIRLQVDVDVRDSWQGGRP